MPSQQLTEHHNAVITIPLLKCVLLQFLVVLVLFAGQIDISRKLTIWEDTFAFLSIEEFGNPNDGHHHETGPKMIDKSALVMSGFNRRWNLEGRPSPTKTRSVWHAYHNESTPVVCHVAQCWQQQNSHARHSCHNQHPQNVEMTMAFDNPIRWQFRNHFKTISFACEDPQQFAFFLQQSDTAMSQNRGVNHARPNFFGKRRKGLCIVVIKIDIKDGFGTGQLAFGQIAVQSGV